MASSAAAHVAAGFQTYLCTICDMHSLGRAAKDLAAAYDCAAVCALDMKAGSMARPGELA